MARDHSDLKRWVKTHTFRIFTALFTLIFFGLAFLYHPEWLSWWLRLITRAIEEATALLPYPWGDRIEVALKGFGGSFWLQITVAIVFVRSLLSLVAAAWRRQWQPRQFERPRNIHEIERPRNIHDIVRRD